MLLLKKSLCDCVSRNISNLKLHSNPTPHLAESKGAGHRNETISSSFAHLLLPLAKRLRQSWKCSTHAPCSPGHGRAAPSNTVHLPLKRLRKRVARPRSKERSQWKCMGRVTQLSWRMRRDAFSLSPSVGGRKLFAMVVARVRIPDW